MDIGKKLQKLDLLLKLNSYNKNEYFNDEYRKLHSFLSFSLKNEKIYSNQCNTINALIDLHIKKFSIEN
jgi:hypothetical protein